MTKQSSISNKSVLPTIVITKIPVEYYSYFQWFLLGLYQISTKGIINLKFHKVSWYIRLSLIIKNDNIAKFLAGINAYVFHLKDDSYCLEGYLLEDGVKKFFCMDCADAPYIFDSDLLEKSLIYFKMQCPKEISQTGFPLTDNIYIPYCDIKYKNINIQSKNYVHKEHELCSNLFNNLTKVKPALLGPRRLSYSNSYKALYKAFSNYLTSGSTSKINKVMCYFGNSQGPVPSNLSSGDMPDYGSESDILGYYSDIINHPNEKRSIVAKLLSDLGSGYDSRLINDGNSDSNNGLKNVDLIIPLDKFCEHVAKFEYNINISGYRLSIPNRFMESFMVGTAIFTDELAVKWYKPFDKEVVETIPMGYHPLDVIDWDEYKRDLLSLPKVSKEEIIQLFNDKWHPTKFANYVIQTIRDAEMRLK